MRRDFWRAAARCAGRCPSGALGSASAADLSPRYPAPTPRRPIRHSTTGPASTSASTAAAPGAPRAGIRSEASTFRAAWSAARLATTGSTGPWVFGLEGDLDSANIKAALSAVCPLGCKTRNSWLSTVRGRVGYAFDRFLPYVTGGAALGNIKARTRLFPGSATTNFRLDRRRGPRIRDHRQLDREGRVSLCRPRRTKCGISCARSSPTTSRSAPNIVRGGLNYRF